MRHRRSPCVCNSGTANAGRRFKRGRTAYVLGAADQRPCRSPMRARCRRRRARASPAARDPSNVTASPRRERRSSAASVPPDRAPRRSDDRFDLTEEQGEVAGAAVVLEEELAGIDRSPRCAATPNDRHELVEQHHGGAQAAGDTRPERRPGWECPAPGPGWTGRMVASAAARSVRRPAPRRRRPDSRAVEALDGRDPRLAARAPLDQALQRLEGVEAVALERPVADRRAPRRPPRRAAGPAADRARRAAATSRPAAGCPAAAAVSDIQRRPSAGRGACR